VRSDLEAALEVAAELVAVTPDFLSLSFSSGGNTIGDPEEAELLEEDDELL